MLIATAVVGGAAPPEPFDEEELPPLAVEFELPTCARRRFAESG
ncbi:hypothetical protein M7I_1446 [Glarea lozoyensis 74030]|uniref:Uncharacterized protein n=1 Tax=Glarea lozoyensis (strain ATCC 74030 / MF5533) TaxID=1104152 RepID=H0EG38_GLAL7|nr:hypothetical protein M7I_1446 [Glarea lozoyensis 74030]